ncbi:MAG: hypothetical protein ACPGXK_09740 [Phycisphaerae bacterium]
MFHNNEAIVMAEQELKGSSPTSSTWEDESVLPGDLAASETAHDPQTPLFAGESALSLAFGFASEDEDAGLTEEAGLTDESEPGLDDSGAMVAEWDDEEEDDDFYDPYDDGDDDDDDGDEYFPDDDDDDDDEEEEFDDPDGDEEEFDSFDDE